MACHPLEGAVVCTGPVTEIKPTGQKVSAAYCPKCKQRTVLELVLVVSVEPSYYGPECRWRCSDCGGLKYAPGWEVG